VERDTSSHFPETMGGVREIQVADNSLVINEHDDVYDSVTGRVLTGSWVWGSALVLSEWMATQGRFLFHFQDKTVLELGAGAGLPGLTAALLGARRVVLTDIAPLLPALVKNVEANGLQDRVEVRELVWGSDEFPSRPGELGEFDLVLMSDLFYDPEEMAALAKTVKRVCGKKETVVWAACEVRPWTAECLSVLASQGFGIVELPNPLGREESLDLFAAFHLTPPSDDMELEVAGMGPALFL
jgi:predicted nicotinamide N-methyase